MQDLESYLSGEFREDQRYLDEITRNLEGIAETFAHAPFSKSAGWAYEVSKDRSQPPMKISHSTTAMILTALQALEWKPCESRPSSAYPIWDDFSPPNVKIPRQLKKNITVATKTLLNSLRRKNDSDGQFLKRVEPQADERKLIDQSTKESIESAHICWSGTFGPDDPLTLGWILETVGEEKKDNDNSTVTKRIRHLVIERLKKLTIGNPGYPAQAVMSPTNGTVADSGYVLARFTRLMRAVFDEIPSVPSTAPSPQKTMSNASDSPNPGNGDPEVTDDKDKNSRAMLDGARDILFNRFETRLHDQLSFKEIPDSRFDPAELAFCLEGMMIIRLDSVDERLFDRVFEVIADAQEANAYWRAETPVLTASTGKVMFPISLETANSLLATCAQFDQRREFYDARGSKYLFLFKRYWRWLEARKATVSYKGERLVGWHSEYVNDPHLIHLWETSQVLEFLLAFRDQLKRHVARQTLTLSRLTATNPNLPEGIEGPRRTKVVWDRIRKMFEPVRCLGPRHKIYELIGEHFYEHHLYSGRKKQNGSTTHKPANWSMLLYGPPGSGKTTVAENLAAALDWPLITVTVSDFLATGGAQVEARAKMLFDTLKAQPRSVVLFDELDQFLLDRDSQHYRDQDTIFQLMTPGMLTKLSDLRKSKTVLFILATNYAERIDAAIKRTGRIDKQYLFLPMDGVRRLEILKRKTFKKSSTAISSGTKEQIDKIRKYSVFLGYRDLENIDQEGPRDAVDLLKIVKRTAPPIYPSAYSARFSTKGDKPIPIEKSPLDEVLALLLIDLDARLPNGLKLTKKIDKKTLKAVSDAHEGVVRCIKDSYDDDKLLKRKIDFAAGGLYMDAGGKAKLLDILEFIKLTSSKKRK